MHDLLGLCKNVCAGDTVFIYEYKDRNNITSIEQMHEITVEEVSAMRKDDKYTIVSGCLAKVKNGKITKSHLFGVVGYIKEGNTIVTKDGEKFISAYFENGEAKKCLKKIKKGYSLLSVFICLKVSEQIEIKTKIPDFLFLSEEEIRKFVSKIRVSYPRLHNNYVSLFIGKNEHEFLYPEIYVNGIKYCGEDGVHEVFKWAIKNKNSINNEVYDFKKIFSCKHIGFEVRKEKAPI